MKRFILFASVFFTFHLRAFIFVPALEREVNLNLSKEPIQTALQKIQDQTGIIFSYQSSILNNVGPITVNINRKTVREALALILPKNILPKPKNNYIILKEKPAEKENKKTELSGYVYDKYTDKKLPNVTIYDKTTLQSVTTDEYGYYSITLPNHNQCLKVNKENYRDTCISIIPQGLITNISIDPVNDSTLRRDTINFRSRLKDFSRNTLNLFKKFKGYFNTLNVKDTITRKFQASLVPFIGTNHLMSGNVYNKYSINIFGGYNRGVKGFEFGSLFNIDKENVKGFQAAGLFNLVGDSVKGAQMAGLFNANGKEVNGFQGAGIFNFNIGKTKGVQMAGIFNLNIKETEGLQAAGIGNFNYKGISGASAAGIMNVNRFSAKGLQAAGIINLVGDTMEGISMAGITNIAWHSKKSSQIAGLFNLSESANGNFQLAGLFNITRKGTTNFQEATFFNCAHHLKGVQIGLFNYADTASGVPIGLFSFVRKGVHQIELSSDELFYANVSFRTGVPAFYNIFSASTQPGLSNPLWSIGYGVGTSVKIKNKLRSDLTLTIQHLSKDGFSESLNEIGKLYIGVEYKFTKKISIAGGPVYNLFFADTHDALYIGAFDNIAPYGKSNTSPGDRYIRKGWIGGKIAIRFF